MKSLLAFALGLVPVAVAAAPVPNVPPPPTIEGKYSLLTSITNSGKGRGNPFGDGPGPGFGTTAAAARREVVITKDTIVIDGRTSTWEYKLDPTTKPMSIDLTILPIRGKKTKAVGIVEATGDKLSIAYAPEGSERPKDFEDADGVTVFVFQKAPPPPRAEYRIVAMRLGREAETEKAINALAKEGFEVAFTATPDSPNDPVVHFVLKRLVK